MTSIEIEDEIINLIFEVAPLRETRLIFASKLIKETGLYAQEIEEALYSLKKKGLHIVIFRDGFLLLSDNFTNLDHSDSSYFDEDDIDKEGRDE
jgi:hypothetical protein